MTKFHQNHLDQLLRQIKPDSFQICFSKHKSQVESTFKAGDSGHVYSRPWGMLSGKGIQVCPQKWKQHPCGNHESEERRTICTKVVPEHKQLYSLKDLAGAVLWLTSLHLSALCSITWYMQAASLLQVPHQAVQKNMLLTHIATSDLDKQLLWGFCIACLRYSCHQKQCWHLLGHIFNHGFL